MGSVMQNVDAIESINVEQLVTITDRLLLRGGLAKWRLSSVSFSASAAIASFW